MRLSTRSLSALALTGALLAGGAPAAAAVSTPYDGGHHPNPNSKTVHKSGFGDVTVYCPAGYHVTGGGVAVDHDEEVATLYSRPTEDGRGWEGSAWGEVEMDEKKSPKSSKAADARKQRQHERAAEAIPAKAGKKSGKAEKESEEEVHGLPITVYAVCAIG